MRNYIKEIGEFERTDREEFINSVIELLKERLAPETTFERKEQLKNNSTRLEGIIIRRPDDRIAPTIYMNSYYESYVDGLTLERIVEDIVECYEKAMGEEAPLPADFELSEENILYKIFYKLINKEANEELLQTVPHREYLDFAIVYCWHVSECQTVLGSVLITDEIAERLQLTEEALFAAATANTPKFFEVTVQPITKVMGNLLDLEDSLQENALSEMEAYPMYVASNNRLQNGATVLLYSQFKERVSELFPEGCFIIPSSIHELILVPKENEPERIREMIHSVNATEVLPEDYLSDSLYVYEADTGTIEIML